MDSPIFGLEQEGMTISIAWAIVSGKTRGHAPEQLPSTAEMRDLTGLAVDIQDQELVAQGQAAAPVPQARRLGGNIVFAWGGGDALAGVAEQRGVHVARSP